MPRPRPVPVYVALIGDLVDSRALPASQRKKLQGNLRVWLQELNRSLDPDSLAAPLTLTAGDEIQGLFRKPSALVKVIQDLTDRMFQLEGHPHMRFGAGRGTLTTGSVPVPPDQAENPAMLDGPAFHNARAALEKAQDEGAWMCFVGFGEPPRFVFDVVLGALFLLMGTIRERWTSKQAELSWRMRDTQSCGKSQKDLAEQMGVSPSVVSEMLKAARHFQLVEGEEAARALLATFDPAP